MRFLQVGLVTVLAGILGLSGTIEAEPETKNEGSVRIRKPKSGDEVGGTFVVEGRTRGVPDGYSVFFFSQEAEDRKKNGPKPSTWPHGPVKANRSFEHKVGGKSGHIWVYVVALPGERIEMIKAWKVKYDEHMKSFGRTGAPGMDREKLFKDSIILGEFDVVAKSGTG